MSELHPWVKDIVHQDIIKEQREENQQLKEVIEKQAKKLESLVTKDWLEKFDRADELEELVEEQAREIEKLRNTLGKIRAFARHETDKTAPSCSYCAVISVKANTALQGGSR